MYWKLLFGTPLDDSPESGEIRAAQMESFARQTPINSMATLGTSLFTMAVLWSAAPRGWLLLWTSMHVALALAMLYRWRVHSHEPARTRVSTRGPRKAQNFAWISGAIWGSATGFLPFLPPPLQLALIVVMASMVGGATTTLAAIPGAAAGFIILTTVPVAVYFAAQGEPAYFGVAAMALVLTLAMLGSTRIAYGALLEEIKARQTNRSLLSQFQAERGEWLEISDTTDAFALFDEHDRLLLWNENYRRILSLPPEALRRGTHRRELLRRGTHPVDVDGEPALRAWIEAEIALAERANGPQIRKYNNGRWLRSHTRGTAEGHRVRIHTDITEIKQAQERATQLAAIVDSTADAVIGLTPDGTIASWNDAAERIFGYRGGEVMGKSITLLPPPDRLDEIKDILERVKLGERISNLETVRRTKDGREVDVSLTASPVCDERGVLVGVSAIYRDISDRKRTEDQLRQAQKMETVGQLTGGVAHDFNTLLGVILGNLELLREPGRDEAERDEMTKAATQAAARGVDLTGRLLAFSRKQPLQPRVTNLNERATEAISLLNRTLDTTIQIRTLLSGRLWNTLIDPTQMETAIINLALNARAAMPEGGTLTIATGNAVIGDDDDRPAELKPGQYVTLSIADSGTGMSEGVLAQAFEPFFTTRDIGQGSGLGLSMVYGFVKQSGGHIAIDSGAGSGTRVSMWFPRTAKRMRQEPAPLAAPPQGAGETILVVEDDSSLLRVAKTMLSSLGYNVLAASDGNAALAMLEQTPDIDLLFTDLALPRGMNGAVLAKQAAQRCPNLKVLYTSGFADYAGQRFDTLEKDVTLVAKPYRKAALAHHVRQLLDQQSA